MYKDERQGMETGGRGDMETEGGWDCFLLHNQASDVALACTPFLPPPPPPNSIETLEI